MTNDREGSLTAAQRAAFLEGVKFAADVLEQGPAYYLGLTMEEVAAVRYPGPYERYRDPAAAELIRRLHEWSVLEQGTT